MLQKFLKEVVTIVVGKQAEEIVDLLDSKKYVNEFLIAKKLDITINQARNILYKISDHGLVSSIRKKDKKKGWYTYFWKIEVLKSLEFLKNILIKRIDQIDHQIKSRETKEFYVCERCNIEFNEENALLHNFTCNECGDLFTLKDNSRILKDFKKNLERLKRKLEFVNEEIRKEKEKLEKEKIREQKKQKKKALEEKLKKKAMNKKLGKKIVKKKLPKRKIIKKKVKKGLKKKILKTKKKPKKRKIKFVKKTKKK